MCPVKYLLTCACVSDSKYILWHKQSHTITGSLELTQREHTNHPCQPWSGLGFILDNLAPSASLSPLAVYGLRLRGNRLDKQWQQRWEETQSLEKAAFGIFLYCGLPLLFYTGDFKDLKEHYLTASFVCAHCLNWTKAVKDAPAFFLLFNTQVFQSLKCLSGDNKQVILLILNSVT